MHVTLKSYLMQEVMLPFFRSLKQKSTAYYQSRKLLQNPLVIGLHYAIVRW